MLEVNIEINCELSRVYESFYNLKLWKAILPDVENVNVYYDDSFHQYFSMSVIRNDLIETIKGFRFCKPNQYIELCQTTPPPGFKKMNGLWRFSNNLSKTIVSVKRDIELIEESKSEKYFHNLRLYLARNLNIFKRHLEHAND